MKMLLVPIFTSRVISKCSTYYALKQLGLSFLRGGADRFVYCVIPTEGEPANYEADDLVRQPRWHNVPVRFLTGDRFQNMLAPPEGLLQFANWGPYWDWDVLVTTSNNGWFWRVFSQARPAVDMRAPRLMLLVDAFPMLTFKKTLSWNPARDVAFLTSYLAFDHVTIQAEHERRGILKSARRVFSPSYVEGLMRRLEVSYPMPSVDMSVAETRTSSQSPMSARYPKSPLRLVYTQRLDKFERRRDEMLDVLRGAFRSSRDIEVLITTNSNTRSISGNDSGFLTFKQSPRAEFYELLKTCDVSLTWSREEGIPYSLLEAAAYGVIPIAKREEWSEEFYGKDYWGLVKTEAEAVAKIRWIAAHRIECRRNFLAWYRGTFRPHVLAAANLEALQEQWIQAHDAAVSARLRESPSTLSTAIQRSGLSVIDLNDIDALSKIDGVRMKEDKKPMQPPISRRRDVYTDRLRLMKLHGWSDTLAPGTLLRTGAMHGSDEGSAADTGRVLGKMEAGEPVES